MGNNDNRVVTWEALNSFITQNGGSPKKSSGANSLALKYGEFSEYAPMATATSSGIVISDYTGIGGGAYTSDLLVIEKDVTWFNYNAPIVMPSSITVTPDATLNPGQTQQLTAVVLPANAADKSVTWSSENTSVATVDQNGLVTAVAVGTVKIYATSNADPNVKGYATITVVAAPVTRYTISWSGEHVSIPGSTSPVQQNEGSSWSGTFVADEGYQIDNITYTGQNVSTSGNTVTVSDLQSDVNITVTTSEIPEQPQVTMTVQDITLRVGEKLPYLLHNYWTLSDNSIQVDTVQYEIADTSIAEIIGEEGSEDVHALAKGETTLTITVNGDIIGTGNITVIDILDYNIDFYRKLRMYDIFGNKSPLRDSYNQSSWNAGIPDNRPDGNWEGVVDYFDGYNIQIFYLDTISDDEFQYMSEHLELSDDSWLTVHLERSGNSATIVAQVDPWTEKIDELIETAAENTEYNQVIGKNVIMNYCGDSYYENDEYSDSRPHRTCIVTLHASDGSSLEVPIIQGCSYAGRCTSGGGSDNSMSIYASSNNIWESIDWYGPEGSNFTEGNRGWDIRRNADVQAFAVLNPASSVQGITGLPSIIVATFPEVGNVYDPSFVKITTTTL